MRGRYLKAIQEGGARYGLDGTEDGCVTELQQQYANEAILMRLQGKIA